MNKLLKPSYYYKDIYSINYQKLKNNNIKYILLDIDNTIGDSKDRVPNSQAIKHIKKLEKEFQIILFSNALPKRVKRYAEILGVSSYSCALKPFGFSYRKFLRDYKINKSSIAAIGDQFYTDILGANKAGITSILVDKISDNENIITKLNRKRENILLRKYNIIERGNYDD